MISKMASLREVWRKCYMSWLLSCYWFSKIILYIKVNAHSLEKSNFSLDLIISLTLSLACSGEGCNGTDSTSGISGSPRQCIC